MEKRYQFRGSLAEQTLAEILFKAHQYNVPGVVEAMRPDAVKRLYLRADEVVFASSSDLKESLGYYLLRTNQLSREDFRRTMRDRRDSEARYGHLIIEQGLLSPAALRRAIQLQTAEVLWDLFSWSEGEVTFSIGSFDPPSHSRIHIPVRLAIKEGIKRAGDARRYLARIGEKDTHLEPDFDSEDLIVASLEEEEFSFLRSIRPTMTLVDLCRSGPFDAPTNGKLLYAFYVLQMVKKVDASSVDEDDSDSESDPSDDARVPTVERTAGAAVKTTTGSFKIRYSAATGAVESAASSDPTDATQETEETEETEGKDETDD